MTGSAVVTYEGTTLDISNCIFTNNTSTTHGGAVANFAGFVTYTDCLFTGNEALQGGAAAGPSCGTMDFTRCVFADNTGSVEGGAVFFNDIFGSTWTDCTLVGNSSPLGAAMFIEATVDNPTMIWNTLIADNTGGAAVEWDGQGVLFFNCSDLYGNTGGDWVGSVAFQGSINGNISVDPVFCTAPGGDPYGLDASSPCSDDASSCGVIGARGVTCDGMVGNEDDLAPEPLPTFTLHPARPNPFNPSTVIAFDLPTPAHARLDILDLRGRHVATLVDAPFGAGEHQATWLARDAEGELSPAGVYLARLTVGDTIELRRLTLLK